MKNVSTITVLFLLLLGTGLVSAADMTDDQSGANQTTHFFLQEASNGSYGIDDSGNYTLTLTGIKPDTIYFTDRPSHEIGFVSTEQYLDNFDWNPNNPPNAVLIIGENDEDVTIIGLELTSPKYDADLNILTYVAQPLEDTIFKSDYISGMTLSENQSVPETFGRGVLLIDDCNCGIVSASACSTYCRNRCWDHSKSACEPCGGCCYSPLLCE